MPSERGYTQPRSEKTPKQVVMSIDEAITQTIDSITKAAMRTPDGSRRVSIGFKDIDSAIGGIAPGELLVISGRPGTGKSALALGAALNAARDGVNVLAVSPGSRPTDVTARLLAFMSHLDTQKLLRGTLSQEDWRKLADAANKLSTCSIRICCQPTPTALDVAEAAKEAFQGAERALIVFDGLEWMASGEEECGLPYWARKSAFELKTVAGKVGACAIATVSPACTADDYPLDLLGAESVADMVMLLGDGAQRRPGCGPGAAAGSCVVQLALTKIRQTPHAVVQLGFLPKNGQLLDYVEEGGQPSKLQDERVEDIALGLGWDKQSVVDALNDLHEWKSS